MGQSLSFSRGPSSWTTWTTGPFAFFFFFFSVLCVAEFFALPFRRAQDQGRELAGATEFEPGHHRSTGGQGSAEISRAGAQEDWYWRHPFAPRGMSGFCNNVRRIAEDRDSRSSTNESTATSPPRGSVQPRVVFFRDDAETRKECRNKPPDTVRDGEDSDGSRCCYKRCRRANLRSPWIDPRHVFLHRLRLVRHVLFRGPQTC